MRTKNHNHDVQFLRYEVRQTEFFAILGHFGPFFALLPPNEPENQMKEISGNIILLQMRTINEDHMIYGS